MVLGSALQMRFWKMAASLMLLLFLLKKNAGSRQVYQSIADCIGHQFRSFVNSQRIHDIGAVYSYGIRAKFKLRRNLFIGFSRADHLYNLQLTGSESSIAFPVQGLLPQQL